MRALVAIVALLSFSLACAGPYTAPADKLVMPKKKKPKDKTAADTVPTEPDTCKVNFDGNPTTISKSNRVAAKQTTQDAENQMSGIEAARFEERRAMVMDALGTLTTALRQDPYSPSATFTMAVAYGWVGRKKCAVKMLERLADLEKHPDVVEEAGKYKAKVKKHPAFEAFKADAEGALGN